MGLNKYSTESKRAFTKPGEDLPDGEYRFEVTGLTHRETRNGDAITLSMVVLTRNDGAGKALRDLAGQEAEVLYWLPNWEVEEVKAEREKKREQSQRNVTRLMKDMRCVLGRIPEELTEENFAGWAEEAIGRVVKGAKTSREYNGKEYFDIYINDSGALSPKEAAERVVKSVSSGMNKSVSGAAGGDEDIPF